MAKKEDGWQKLYESLAVRNEALERENRTLRMQVLMVEAQGRNWEIDKVQQQNIIQDQLDRMNTRYQEQAEEIMRLRALLKEVTEIV